MRTSCSHCQQKYHLLLEKFFKLLEKRYVKGILGRGSAHHLLSEKIFKLLEKRCVKGILGRDSMHHLLLEKLFKILENRFFKGLLGRDKGIALDIPKPLGMLLLEAPF